MSDKTEKFNSTNLVHICDKPTGKMQLIPSISTSCMCNENCKKYQNIKGSICEKCYSENMHKHYGDKFQKCYRENTELLTSRILAFCELPFINSIYFRFESFGDLNNETQFINYLNICKKNPRTSFAIWTKNPHIIHKVFSKMGYKKPNNLNIGISSLFVNKVANVTAYEYFVDFVFTVYSLDYVIEHDIKINCGSKSCYLCGKCYNHMKKNHETVYINELVKQDQSKANKLGMNIEHAF